MNVIFEIDGEFFALVFKARKINLKLEKQVLKWQSMLAATTSACEHWLPKINAREHREQLSKMVLEPW